MDISLPPPSGPRKVSEPKNQLVLPPEVMGELALDETREVWVVINPDRPGTLVVIPRPLMQELWRKAWTSV